MILILQTLSPEDEYPFNFETLNTLRTFLRTFDPFIFLLSPRAHCIPLLRTVVRPPPRSEYGFSLSKSPESIQRFEINPTAVSEICVELKLVFSSKYCLLRLLYL